MARAPAQPLVETETWAGVKARGPGGKRKVCVCVSGPAEFVTYKYLTEMF